MNELKLYATTWMNLTNIMMNKGSQAQMSIHPKTPWIEKSVKIRKNEPLMLEVRIVFTYLVGR